MHDDLKQRLRDEVDAELGTRPPRNLSDVLTRGRSKRLALRLVTTMSMVLLGTALVAGGFWIAGVRSPSTERSPVQPAGENASTPEPTTNETLENEGGPRERYDIVDGEVTFAATYPPWGFDPDWVAESPRTMAALTADLGGIRIVADPLPVGTGCEADAAPADAQAWAERILSDPDIEATEPTPTRIAGVDALQMDLAPAAGASICDSGDEPVLFNSSEQPEGGWRSQIGLWHRYSYRVYLLDVPAGSSRIVAVVVFGFERNFDEVLEAAAPVLDSLEFHAP
jgi:hypothetical protein